MRRTILAGLVLLSTFACGITKSEPKAPIQKFHLHGVIQSLDDKVKSATIKHQKIEGFMDAMTMEFPVKDTQEFSHLRTGETIDATVYVQDVDFWIGEIKETK